MSAGKSQLTGMRPKKMSNVLVISENDFEDSELFYPMYRLIELGFNVKVASKGSAEIKGKHGYIVKCDLKTSDIKPGDYSILLLPGGKSPEKVRLDEHALSTVKHFASAGKLIAAICHGPQILISAKVISGRKATSYVGVRDDLIAAGAIYIDASVVVDRNLITSRTPSDLPDFMREIAKLAK